MHLVQQVDIELTEERLQERAKCMFLYSAVSSPLDHSKRFTLSSPGRPVHSGTNSTSLGSILAMQ